MGYDKGISDMREWGDRDDIRDCRNIGKFRNIGELRNIAEFINMNSDYMFYSLTLSLSLSNPLHYLYAFLSTISSHLVSTLLQ